MSRLLEIQDLQVALKTPQGWRNLVHVERLVLQEGEVLGLVGETGSGKTLTAMSIPRLFASPAIQVVGGSIYLGDTDVTALPERDLLAVRGKKVGVVFQDAGAALNPLFPVEEPVRRAVALHQGLRAKEASKEAARLFEEVGLGDLVGEGRYPHELSGGQKQRAMLAWALAGRPGLLLADEPTTALDVTVQVQIIALLQRLQRERGMAVLFITHNLALLQGFARQTAVMYGGRVMEWTDTSRLLEEPWHPYTSLLLQALPSLEKRELVSISGRPPTPGEAGPGCPFAPRCPLARDICRQVRPSLEEKEPGHWVACHLPKKEGWE
ncbi:MAG: ABC transporter ATP-binding protein [Bacillota bacterium]|nr:ABC transporter ATP-binding protein [Bacillota bacterium]